jgi:hypothetical protein
MSPDMSVIAAFDAEIAELETSLANDPRSMRIGELRRMKEEYRKISAPTELGTTVARLLKAATAPGRKPSPERVRALEETKVLLNGRATPTKTADILGHLQEHGISIGGNDPQNNLSAMLYHSKEFQSHGRSGWTLKNGSAQ